MFINIYSLGKTLIITTFLIGILSTIYYSKVFTKVEINKNKLTFYIKRYFGNWTNFFELDLERVKNLKEGYITKWFYSPFGSSFPPAKVFGIIITYLDDSSETITLPGWTKTKFESVKTLVKEKFIKIKFN